MQPLGDGDGGAQTWRLRGGAQQLSEGLAALVRRAGGTVLLGHPVSRISSPAGGQGGEVLVTTARGVRVRARHVVVAIPPPLWSTTITWEVPGGAWAAPPPPAAAEGVKEASGPWWSLDPAARAAGLNASMTMGSTVKCITLYDSPWWAEPQVRRSLLA